MLGILDIPLIQPKSWAPSFRGRTLFTLPVRPGRYYSICGGPYKEKPQGLTGVKMAREISLHKNGDHEINIPTQDYDVPPLGDLSVGLVEAVKQITEGKLLYVGCMAGRGRTGLFLAILCRAFGVKNPVEYVRAHYFAHAVETLDQYKFVQAFPIPAEATAMVARARAKNTLNFTKHLTKQSVSS